MIILNTFLGKQTASDPVDDVLSLPWSERRKCRRRVCLESGMEVKLMLPRGTILRGGDIVKAENGMRVKVRAEQEHLSTAEVSDPLLLTRVAYHLGNRHVAAEIHPERIIYLHDHVLDDMVRGLGGDVSDGYGPFEPEDGAYMHGGHH